MVGWLDGGTTRAEDAQGTPTQSHLSPSILVYEDQQKTVSHLGCSKNLVHQMGAVEVSRIPIRAWTGFEPAALRDLLKLMAAVSF